MAVTAYPISISGIHQHAERRVFAMFGDILVYLLIQCHGVAIHVCSGPVIEHIIAAFLPLATSQKHLCLVAYGVNILHMESSFHRSLAQIV